MSNSTAAAIPPRQRVDSVAAGLIAVIFLTEAAIGVLLIAVNSQYPQAKLGAGLSLTGWALSLYFASKVIGQPLSGWLADRSDPRRVLLTGCFAAIPAIVLMERWHNQGAYALLWVVFGLSLAVIWPCMYAIVGRRVRSSVQGRLFAIVSIAQIAGTFVGAGSGGFIIDYLSYTAAFVEAIVCMGAACLIAIWVIPRSAAGRVAAQTGEHLLEEIRTVGPLLSSPVLLLALLIAIMSFGTSMVTPDLKPYSANVLGLKFSTFLALMVIPGAAAGLFLVPSGYIADHFGRIPPLLAGLLLFPISVALLTLTRAAGPAMAIATVAAIGYVLCLPALSATLLDLTTTKTRGAVTGFATSVQAIGGVIGAPIGGRLIDTYGALAPLRAASVLVLLAFCLALVYSALIRGQYRPADAPGDPVA